MTRSLRTRTILVLTLVAAMVPPAAPTAAVASDPPVPNTSTVLSIKEFRQILLDEAHSQLFFRTTNEVLVTDLTGVKTRTFRNLGGGGDMALSEDGTTLWVPLREDHEVLRISTADLTKAGRIRLPDDICPTSVAETNGRLAIGHECTDVDTDGIGVVDLATKTFTDSGDHAAPSSRPLVATSPGAPDLVVASTRSRSPSSLVVYDLSSGTPVRGAGTSYGGFIRDLAINPSGKLVIAAAGSPYVHQAFRLPDLEPRRTFMSDSYPDAAAWSGDGQVMVGGTDGGGPNVWVFRPTARKAEIVHYAGSSGVAHRGIAVDHYGHYIWAVTPRFGRYDLTVLPGFDWGTCKGRPVSILGTDGDDVIKGSAAPDVILAGAGNDTIKTASGDDVICAQGGDDLIVPGHGDDIVDGGGGRDTVSFADKVDPSQLIVDLSAGTASGLGDDTLARVENVVGSFNDDTIIGDAKVNDLRGGSGHDYIEGGGRNDKIAGGTGDDLLVGGDGNDTLLGQDGDDVLAGIAGNDILKGGDGDDTASFALSPDGVTVSLASKSALGEGDDRIVAIEWIVGTEQDDHLTGNGSPNLLESRGGNDRLHGEGNDDLLAGGSGTDTLDGGPGYDACYDGESHSSCELIDTTAAAIGIPWSLDVIGDAVVFVPRIRLE